jgi:uncharacterized protein (DUF934 family)
MLLDETGVEAAPLTLEVLAIGDTTDPRSLAAEIASAGAVALIFPAFRNGRAYSQAAVLRKMMGFKGLLIARGDILVDQVRLMREAGFNRFDVDDPARAAAVAAMLARPDPARWRQTGAHA